MEVEVFKVSNHPLWVGPKKIGPKNFRSKKKFHHSYSQGITQFWVLLQYDKNDSFFWIASFTFKSLNKFTQRCLSLISIISVVQLGTLLMRKVLRKETGVSTGTQPLSVIMEEKMCDKTFPTAVVTMSGQVKQSLDDIGDAVLSSPIDKILHGDFPILIGHPESWSNPVGQNLLRNLKKNGQVVLHFIDELHQGLESH